mmetsp:Transcript_5859/g.13192  ORF Transcript_5859/g.13192 Transcript_5859/m.13192 type:complete len:202 (-) Transcript_5859:574-1179(-)
MGTRRQRWGGFHRKRTGEGSVIFIHLLASDVLRRVNQPVGPVVHLAVAPELNASIRAAPFTRFKVVSTNRAIPGGQDLTNLVQLRLEEREGAGSAVVSSGAGVRPVPCGEVAVPRRAEPVGVPNSKVSVRTDTPLGLIFISSALSASSSRNASISSRVALTTLGSSSLNFFAVREWMLESAPRSTKVGMRESKESPLPAAL